MNNEEKGIVSPYSIFLNEKQIQERSFDLVTLTQASRLREMGHPQFDGMSYLKWNETNEKADMSFIPPRRNKIDSHINSGITHEKDTSLVSLLMTFNFEGTVRIFYKGEELYDVGVAFTEWIRKTRQDERYDEKREGNYRNLIVQGTSFVREKFVEMEVPDKILVDSKIDFTRLDEVRFNIAGKKKIVEGCTSYLVDPKKVFLENIYEQDIRKQAGVIIIDRVSRYLLEPVFGNNPRWKYVPKSIKGTWTSTLTTQTIYNEWAYAEVMEDTMEIIEVFRPFENRYQLYLNGVPMLPTEFPLTAISPSGLVPLAKGDIDRVNMFAYSKGIPSKTKIDQAVYDMILKLVIIKSQQSAFVPRGNNTGKIISERVFYPSAVTKDIDPAKLPALIDNPGVQNNDFNLLDFLNKQIENKSISSILEGQAGGSSTLGEYMDQQKKASVRVNNIFNGVINWEKQMLELRFANLLANGARPKVGMASYKDVSFASSFDDEGQGMRVIKFEEENFFTPEDIFTQEIEIEKSTGNQVRIHYFNPKKMLQILNNPDYSIIYEINPVDKNNDKLAQAMFMSQLVQAKNIWPEATNDPKLKRRFASKIGEKYDDWFLSDEELEFAQMEQMNAMQQQQQQLAQPKMPASGKELAVDEVFQ